MTLIQENKAHPAISSPEINALKPPHQLKYAGTLRNLEMKKPLVFLQSLRKQLEVAFRCLSICVLLIAISKGRVVQASSMVDKCRLELMRRGDVGDLTTYIEEFDSMGSHPKNHVSIKNN